MTDKQYGAHGVQPDIPRPDEAATAAELYGVRRVLTDIIYYEGEQMIAEKRAGRIADAILAAGFALSRPSADVNEVARDLGICTCVRMPSDMKNEHDPHCQISKIAAALTARDARAADAVAALTALRPHIQAHDLKAFDAVIEGLSMQQRREEQS